MEKTDLFKQFKDEYIRPKKPTVVQAKTAKYLAIDGKGKPGGDEFRAAIGALYGMAYTIKMTRKFSGGEDFKVCALEALYWADDPSRCIVEQGMENFNWTLMIRMPTTVKDRDVLAAAAKLKEKGKDGGGVRLVTLKEGKCVQMLHTGPYDKEAETISRMQEFCAANGFVAAGHHHEIYISDPNRVPPERLRTILRQPIAVVKKVKAAGA